jgi:hypothetical protein
MKSIEIILRLFEKLLQAISFRKAQNEHDQLSKNPANWFSTHFGYGVSDTADKTDKTAPSSDTTK